MGKETFDQMIARVTAKRSSASAPVQSTAPSPAKLAAPPPPPPKVKP